MSTPTEPVIRVRHASIGYDGTPTVRHVDLEVSAGEVVTVLGPNGSGKSTLVKGMLGLADLYDGSIQLFGSPSGDLHERWRVGYVPQRHTVAGAMPSSVREVVASGRLARRGWWRRANGADRHAVDDALDVVGLSERAHVNVAELSGGQQRRVLIARALAGEPQVLLMDEPTAGVDSSQQHALAAALATLAERTVTMLVVTHEIGPLAGLATRAVVMRDGTVEHDGPLLPWMLHEHDLGDSESHHDEPPTGPAPAWVAEPRIGGG